MILNNNANGVLYIVDDHDDTCAYVSALMQSISVDTQCFTDAETFLSSYQPNHAECLLLDLVLPGMSGFDLQAEMKRRGIDIPTIIVTAYADVQSAVLCLKSGAYDYMEKPVNNHTLIDRVRKALDISTRINQSRKQINEIRTRLGTLTQREAEVLQHVVNGFANKDIAGQLGISIKTVEVHRSNLMEKMAADSLAQLVKMYIQIND